MKVVLHALRTSECNACGPLAGRYSDLVVEAELWVYNYMAEITIVQKVVDLRLAKNSFSAAFSSFNYSELSCVCGNVSTVSLNGEPVEGSCHKV